MKILADENIDRPIADWLRDRGHDVREVIDTAAGAPDADVVELARSEGRILLTFDRDMGWILRHRGYTLPGVVYLRIRASGPALWEAFYRVWPQVEPVAAGHFLTVRNDRVVARSLALE